jgi:hypothetical protein
MLRLVPAGRPGPDRDVQAYDMRPHDLVSRPQRPGELTVAVVIDLDAAARAHVSNSAREAGVPASLWLTVAIEAQRSLDQATALVHGDDGELAAELDNAAGGSSATTAHETSAPALAQLRSYAMALRAGAAPSGGSLVGTSLPVFPALHVAGAWAIEAGHHGLAVSAWAANQAAARPAGRVAWEAAAASSGQTLSEWVLAQAVRRARSSSTFAHTPARG